MSDHDLDETVASHEADGPLRVPDRIGRYRLVREIGRGGMSVVHEAEDSAVGRRVAVKLLRVPRGLDARDAEGVMTRFFREARAIGLLSHPNIVVVHDVGRDEPTGEAFMAMELLHGPTLRQLLDQGVRLTPQQTLDLCLQVAEGLDHAHEHGVVHRDVKPGNVVVLEDGTVKLMDFGIAHVAGSTLTEVGELHGTPDYMSPEQVTGAPVDARSDLFSLGVVLHELLTGQRPFEGRSANTVTYRIVHAEPLPPSRVDPRVPPQLDAILARLLAKDPARRYQSGAEVAEALRGVGAVGRGRGGPAPAAGALEGAAEADQPTHVRVPLVPPAVRRVWPFALAVAAVVVVTALVFGRGGDGGSGARPAETGRTPAQRPAGDAGAATAAATTPADDGAGRAASPARPPTERDARPSDRPGPRRAAGDDAGAVLADAAPAGGTAAPQAVLPPSADPPAAAASPPPEELPAWAAEAIATRAGDVHPVGARAPAEPERVPASWRREGATPPRTAAPPSPSEAATLPLEPATSPARVTAAPGEVRDGTTPVRVRVAHALKDGLVTIELDGEITATIPLEMEGRSWPFRRAEQEAAFDAVEGDHDVRVCLSSPHVQRGPLCSATPGRRFVMNRPLTIRVTHRRELWRHEIAVAIE